MPENQPNRKATITQQETHDNERALDLQSILQCPSSSTSASFSFSFLSPSLSSIFSFSPHPPRVPIRCRQPKKHCASTLLARSNSTTSNNCNPFQTFQPFSQHWANVLNLSTPIYEANILLHVCRSECGEQRCRTSCKRIRNEAYPGRANVLYRPPK